MCVFPRAGFALTSRLVIPSRAAPGTCVPRSPRSPLRRPRDLPAPPPRPSLHLLCFQKGLLLFSKTQKQRRGASVSERFQTERSSGVDHVRKPRDTGWGQSRLSLQGQRSRLPAAAWPGLRSRWPVPGLFGGEAPRLLAGGQRPDPPSLGCGARRAHFRGLGQTDPCGLS